MCVQPYLTYTSCPADVGSVANLAEAAEGAHGVDTLAISAEAGHDLTLVNICRVRNKEKGIEVNACRVETTRNDDK